jgi:hypothetical protein
MDQNMPILWEVDSNQLIDFNIEAEYLQEDIVWKYLDSHRSVKRACTLQVSSVIR